MLSATVQKLTNAEDQILFQSVVKLTARMQMTACNLHLTPRCPLIRNEKSLAKFLHLSTTLTRKLRMTARLLLIEKGWDKDHGLFPQRILRSFGKRTGKVFSSAQQERVEFS